MQFLRSVHIKIKTLTAKILNHVSFGLKLAIITVCLVMMFDGHYPPVHAQSRRIQTVPVITTEDAMQDDRIAALNRHLEATDARVESLRQTMEATGNDVSAVRGEIEAFGLLLTVLSIAALVIQIRRKQV
jgi:hypothetical protein